MSRGYEPRWDLDLALGEEQELLVDGILAQIRNGGRVEVKTDFYLNASIFLEVMDRRRGKQEWRSTGFRTTEAPLVVINKPGLNALHVYRARDLRDLEARGLLGPMRDGGQGGDCPTRGYVVTASQLDAALRVLARGRDEMFDQDAS